MTYYNLFKFLILFSYLQFLFKEKYYFYIIKNNNPRVLLTTFLGCISQQVLRYRFPFLYLQ